MAGSEEWTPVDQIGPLWTGVDLIWTNEAELAEGNIRGLFC